MIDRRWFRCAGACVVALGCASAGTARAQVVTVSVRSAEDLLSQARALLKAVDPDGARPALDAMDKLDEPGALKGLDRARPLTAFVDHPEPGAPSTGSVFVPVTDGKAFLKALEGFGLAVDDAPGVEGFSHKVSPRGGNAPPLYVLSAPPTGYVVLSTAPAGADRLRGIKPPALRPTRPGVLTAEVRLDRVPDQYKTQLLDGLERNAAGQRERKPGEDEPTYQGRLAGMTLVHDAVTAFVRDGREVSLDLDVDAKRGRLAMALGADAKPGTPTARSLATYGIRKSRFGGLTWAAVSLKGILPIPEALRVVIHQGIKAGRDKAADEKDGETRRLIGLLLDAVEPTLTGDDIDACVAVDGRTPGGGKGDTVVALFGVAVKDSKRIEGVFREAVAKGKPEGRGKVVLDFAKGDDGTPIHRVTLDPSGMKKDEFGEPWVFVALPEGAALAAVGEGGLAVIRRAMTTIKTPAPRAPQLGLDLAARRAPLYASGENREATQSAARDVFVGPNSGNDRIQVGLTSGKAGAILRLDADLPVLRFFFLVGSRQKDKARQDR